MSTTSAEVEELIDSTVSIPTIPTVLNEINAVLASPDGSAKDAAGVIERDPAIATRALRLVNSSCDGLRNPVSNINLGCSILGLQVISNHLLILEGPSYKNGRVTTPTVKMFNSFAALAIT